MTRARITRKRGDATVSAGVAGSRNGYGYHRAIYAHFGYREVERKTVGGYRRVYLEKPLPPTGA